MEAQFLASFSSIQQCADRTDFPAIVLQELNILMGGRLAEPGAFCQGPDDPHLPSFLGDVAQTVFETGMPYWRDRLALLALPGRKGVNGLLYVPLAAPLSRADQISFNIFAETVGHCFDMLLHLERTRELAYRDSLTGLGNRVRFRKEIQRVIDSPVRGDDGNDRGTPLQFAVVQFVLDHLPELNIALGHAAGDRLLLNTAARLRRAFPAAIALARTSGDGFGVCVPYETDHELALIPEQINGLFGGGSGEGMFLPHLEPRIGITCYPEDGRDADSLWKNSNIALAHSKGPEQKNFSFYDNRIEEQIHARVHMSNSLRHGIADNRFSLHYQPKVCLQSGSMRGVEALLRWQREDGTPVPAKTFVPLAEASGLIDPISEWVLKEACRQRAVWLANGLAGFPVAVNIPASQLQQSEFVDQVRQALAAADLPPDLLEIELTESVVMENRQQVMTNMRQLCDLGVCFSIDDFGTGYSSLSYLTHLPASVLKIDKSFVDGVLSRADNATITRSIIALGNNLGMRVLAEGVETREQVAFMKAAGCLEAQGFVFSKPVAPEYIPEMAGEGYFSL
ncbi:putative bifunctional diguanylate cyclase/phosphodiesterase [Sneathiella chinensis]|uniref:GGDEF domain-containing protein n=1 Tax=Sneathiella chinensis TaxID=349750 RepID=A0ABQ5U553_9PROT|nr:bifunctional diguanylate cyclase/phosphodiesterase [Sneathiella chinensis]GLQ06531.1 hypothetical protein GCM10007924_17520 [Sneathiella chinensis]